MKTNSERALESQARRKKKRLCILCGEPMVNHSNNFCEKHLDDNRTRARNRYRIKRGIPLDQPVSEIGRKRMEDL